MMQLADCNLLNCKECRAASDALFQIRMRIKGDSTPLEDIFYEHLRCHLKAPSLTFNLLPQAVVSAMPGTLAIPSEFRPAFSIAT